MAETVIKKVAIHKLTRIKDVYNITLGNSNMSVTATVQRIVDELHNLYAKRPSKSYGKFEEDEIEYPTVTRVRNYIENNADFSVLSSGMMDTLKNRAQAKPASSGGNVFFTHFEKEEHQFLLVAVVTDKLGAALTGSGDIKDVTHLDVDGFRFAGRIDMTGWSKGDSRYISFLKGKGEVAEYFREFLACNNVHQSKTETRSLVEALKNFTELKEYTSTNREAFLQKAYNICQRDLLLQKPINFTALANELTPDDPEVLTEYLSAPELQLNDGFMADRRSLKSFVNLKRKTKDWQVEFDRKSIHNNKVRYNAENRTLTLYDVPDDFHSELKEEMPGDG